MPYVVTRVEPRETKVDLFDFLDGLVDMGAFRPITKFDTSNTRTFYYDHITPQKLSELNIPRQIDVLEKFYERYKHLDINGDPEYDYEKQVDLFAKYKLTKGDIKLFKEKEENNITKSEKDAMKKASKFMKNN